MIALELGSEFSERKPGKELLLKLLEKLLIQKLLKKLKRLTTFLVVEFLRFSTPSFNTGEMLIDC